MLNFDLNEDHILFQDSIRNFIKSNIAKGVLERDEKKDIPHSLIKKIASQGFLGIHIPSKWGGAESDLINYVIAVRELASVDASLALIFSIDHIVLDTLVSFGSQQQIEEHVPKIINGDYFSVAFAMSEMNIGSDIKSIHTYAEKKNDVWVLNGAKRWVTNGDKEGIAIVFAQKADNTDNNTQNLNAFIVPLDTKGIIVRKTEDKMGLYAAHSVSLQFENVELSEDSLLGNEGEGFNIAMSALNIGRLGVSAQAVGIASSSLDIAKKYSQERKQFTQPISKFQAIQFKLADMLTYLDSSWLLTLRAAWMKSNNLFCKKEISMAKLYSSEMSNRIVREAVQILGGYGYIEEFPVARNFRDCRSTQIYSGTNEIQRVIIAQEILKEVKGI